MASGAAAEDLGAAVEYPGPGLGADHEITVVELEEKLRELEFRFLGKETPSSMLSPFTPISTLRKRIEQFRSSLHSSTGEGTQTKLPPVPLPILDGTDLELFLKEFERWMRLSWVDKSGEVLQLDWLVQASAPKVKRIVERVGEEQEIWNLCWKVWPSSSPSWKMT